jgi:hypothetical protein
MYYPTLNLSYGPVDAFFGPTFPTGWIGFWMRKRFRYHFHVGVTALHVAILAGR